MNKFFLLIFASCAFSFAGFSKSDLLNNNLYKAPLGGPCEIYSIYKVNNGNWSPFSKTGPQEIFGHDTIILNANDSVFINIYWEQIRCSDFYFTPPQWFFNGTILEGETFNGPMKMEDNTTSIIAKDSGEYKIIIYSDLYKQIIYTHTFYIVKPTQTTENKLSCALFSKYAINGTWSNSERAEFHNTYFSHSDTINLSSSDSVTFNIYKYGPACGNQLLTPISPCRWYFNDTIPIEGVFTGIYKTNVAGSYKAVYGYFPNQYTFNYNVINNSGGTSVIPECKLYSQYLVNGIWSSPLPCSYNGSFRSSSLISLGLTDSVNIKIYKAGPACANQDTNSVMNKGYWKFYNSDLPTQSNLFTTNIPGIYYFNYTDGSDIYHLNFNIQKPSGNIGCNLYSQYNINGTTSTPSTPHFNSSLGYYVDSVSINLPQGDSVLLSVYKQGNYCLNESYLNSCKWSFTSPNYSYSAYNLTETSTSYKAINAGYYTVVYGYTYAITFHVNSTTSNEYPHTTVNAGPDHTVCKNSIIQLAGTVSGTNNFTWTGGSGSFNPNAKTLTATYVPSSADISAGNINLTLTAVSVWANGSSADIVKLTFLPTPIVNAGADQTVSGTTPVAINGSVTNATGGIWTTSGSGSFSPNNTTLNASYTPSDGDVAAGNVTLILTSTGNICINSDTMLITVNSIGTGLTGSSSLDFFKVSPNPTSDLLNIELGQTKEDILISLYNTLGEKLMDRKLNNSSTIDLKNFSKGLYYLILSNGEGQRMVKVVKD